MNNGKLHLIIPYTNDYCVTYARISGHLGRTQAVKKFLDCILVLASKNIWIVTRCEIAKCWYEQVTFMGDNFHFYLSHDNAAGVINCYIDWAAKEGKKEGWNPGVHEATVSVVLIEKRNVHLAFLVC